jgi:hypothetical protein
MDYTKVATVVCAELSGSMKRIVQDAEYRKRGLESGKLFVFDGWTFDPQDVENTLDEPAEWQTDGDDDHWLVTATSPEGKTDYYIATQADLEELSKLAGVTASVVVGKVCRVPNNTVRLPKAKAWSHAPYLPEGDYEVKSTNSRTTELYMLWKGQRQSVYKVQTSELLALPVSAWKYNREG